MIAINYRESELPPDQPYIQTSILKHFLDFAQLLADRQHHDALMGIAVGASGIGKSVAQRCYQEQLPREGVCSKSLSIQVGPHLTPCSLITQLLGAFGGTTNTRRSPDKVDRLAEVIYHKKPRLVTLDGADRLSDACFEMLCSLFDMTRCPLLLVGLPPLLPRIQRHPRMSDMVGLYLKFIPLSFEEVLYEVLPALVFPGWVFNPAQEADRLLAEQLWEFTRPSLRRLRNILGTASTLAHMQHEPNVTHACIQRAMHMVLPPLDRTSSYERIATSSYERTPSRQHEKKKTQMPL